jgi:arylsulfatase A-like enzyme
LDSLAPDNVTRQGIPFRSDGSSEQFRLRVPRSAKFEALLGVAEIDDGMNREEPVNIEFLVSICTESGEPNTDSPIERIEFEGPGWHPVHFGLEAYSGTEIELCVTAQSSSEVSMILADGHVGTPKPAGTKSKRPNLLLITLDTTRADHLGSSGYERDTSPHLDRLASEGEQYLNAVTNSSWTLPSHASLFTGKHPREHGARSHILGTHSLMWSFFGLPLDELTLAERLSLLGYRTGAVVAGSMLSVDFGFSQGFDYYNQLRNSQTASSLEANAFGERTGQEVTDLALEWLDDSRRPFFLFLNYFDPHWPFTPPEALAGTWSDGDAAALSNDDYRSIWRDVMTEKRALSESERKTMVDLYDAEILAMDGAIGRLLDALKASDDYDETMIVVVSDHGEAFGEHRTVDHGVSLYEEQLRAVLIVKYPKMGGRYPPGQRFDHRVDLLDTHATMLRELGLAIGPDGPVASPPKRQPHGIAAYGLHKKRLIHFAELNRNPWIAGTYGKRFDRDLEAVYRGRFKLIRSDRGVVELYDLQSDPYERNNLAATEVETVRELEGELDAWAEVSPWQYNTGKPVPLSPALSDQLKALGYATGGRSAADPRPCVLEATLHSSEGASLSPGVQNGETEENEKTVHR